MPFCEQLPRSSEITSGGGEIGGAAGGQTHSSGQSPGHLLWVKDGHKVGQSLDAAWHSGFYKIPAVLQMFQLCRAASLLPR